MVHIVNAGNISQYSAEIQQAYCLRHRVFVDERHWEALRKPDGREVDQFDTDRAIHVMEIESRAVVGYSRLIPTTEPHLLSDVYPQLAQRRLPRAPDVFEWTRYCVSPEKRSETAIGNVGSRLLFGVLEYAFNEGMSGLTMQADPIWTTRFDDFGFDVEPLGLPQLLEGEEFVALSIGLSVRAINKCRRLLRIKPRALETRGYPLPAISLPTTA